MNESIVIYTLTCGDSGYAKLKDSLIFSQSPEEVFETLFKHDWNRDYSILALTPGAFPAVEQSVYFRTYEDLRFTPAGWTKEVQPNGKRFRYDRWDITEEAIKRLPKGVVKIVKEALRERNLEEKEETDNPKPPSCCGDWACAGVEAFARACGVKLS